MADVLVTGATGFIGSAVTRALVAAGRQVRALVEPGADPASLGGLEVEILNGDVRDPEAVARAVAGCCAVYHLAAVYRVWVPDPGPLFEINVGGTANVLGAALAAGVERVVHTSSIAAVGIPGDGRLADETMAFDGWRAANAYVRSKVLSEQVALGFARAGLPVVVVNPAFPFGPGDTAPTPTGRIVLDLLRRRVPGCFDGGFAVIDVDDVAAGHLAAEARGRPGERYLLANHNVSYREFFDLVGRVAGVKVPRWNLPRPLALGIGLAAEALADHVTRRPPLTTYGAVAYATRHLYVDNRKAREELGLPARPLEETVARAVEWFRARDRA